MLRGPRPVDPSRAYFAAGLGLSLLLHALLLALPTRVDTRHDAPRTMPAAQTLTLRLPAAHEPKRSATPSTPPAMTPQQRGKSPRPMALRRSPSSDADHDASAATLEATAQRAPAPTIDLDALRAQARDLARRPAEPRIHVGGERPAPQQAAPDLADRPSLETVARRIGQPLRGASERQLADGTWMIRFAGNVCLRVPAHLPLGQENPFGPTVLVPTNCPD